MSAQKVSDRLYLSQVDVKTQTPGVYKKGSSYRVLTRPDGKRKVMLRFDTYEEAVAFKQSQPSRLPRLVPYRDTSMLSARGRRALAAEYLACLRRDPCAYCDEPAAVVDHIIPVSADGPDHWTNLTGACSACNSRKHAKLLLTFLAQNHGCWEWHPPFQAAPKPPQPPQGEPPCCNGKPLFTSQVRC